MEKLSTKKVVINSCYGGFGLNDAALKILELDALDHIDREDAKLINLIESGFNCGTNYCEPKVVEIPYDVDYIILDYDGKEEIRERSRVWF